MIKKNSVLYTKYRLKKHLVEGDSDKVVFNKLDEML